MRESKKKIRSRRSRRRKRKMKKGEGVYGVLIFPQMFHLVWDNVLFKVKIFFAYCIHSFIAIRYVFTCSTLAMSSSEVLQGETRLQSVCSLIKQ